MRGLVLFLLALGPIACSGAQKATDADWTPEPPPKDRPLRETEALNAAQPLNAEKQKQWASIGVRHDLMLARADRTARCGCLAIEVGKPKDKHFFWTGGVPEVGVDTLAIAIDARGVACPGGETDDARRRPSISAIDQHNDDVIIEVEDLPPGMPLASGAIIPKPGAKGSIYVKPRHGSVIYGRNPGAQYCRVR